MVSGSGGVVRVGMGSSLYEFVGSWVPSGLVGYMMGMRGVTSQGEFGGGNDSGCASSGDVSPGSGSNVTGIDGLDRSEYVNVYEEKDIEEERYS
jgi:hypothetical protein